MALMVINNLFLCFTLFLYMMYRECSCVKFADILVLQLAWYIWLIVTSKEEESHTCLLFFMWLYEVYLQLIKQPGISSLFN